MSESWVNKLFYGDNLRVLRESIPDESVDLIYLDPPFNSKADYNVLFENQVGQASEAQTVAFKDTWEWDQTAVLAFDELMMSAAVPKKLKDLMLSLKVFLTGDTGKQGNSMMAYLTMMALRLNELNRTLKPTGSIYLHCDPTASHYLKLILDGAFGWKGFRAEIIWKRTNSKGLAFTRYASNHDTLLFYSKSDSWTWNSQYKEHDQSYLDSFYRFTEPETGRVYRLDNLANPNKNRPNLTYEFLGVTRVWRWTKDRMQKAYEDGLVVQSKPGSVPSLKRYLDEQEGTPVDTVWTDIKPVQSQAKERLGYPTQKPEALLERIIRASSNEDDVVLDPFCGCGTTVAVAERLGRRWVGIDITYLAVDLMERRLLDIFTPGNDFVRLSDVPATQRRKALKTYWETGEDPMNIGLRPGLHPYEVLGDPKDLDSAKALADADKYQFEWWCIAMVGAQGKEYKKGSDRGIDGTIPFMDKEGDYQHVLVSVKGGKNVGVGMVRDLVGTMDRESSAIGVLVSLEEPTAQMVREAANAGVWTSEFNGTSYPRVQLISVQQIFAGHRIEFPRHGVAAFKKAPRAKNTDKGNLNFDI